MTSEPVIDRGGEIVGRPICDDDSGFTYEPWKGPNGEMGYRITAPDGAVSYFFLNPSNASDDAVPTIFVYHDDAHTTTPANSLHYYDVRTLTMLSVLIFFVVLGVVMGCLAAAKGEDPC